jgi:hypothetical protein
MTHARPLRSRLLALLGTMALGLALIPAGAAIAVVPTAGNISGTITGVDIPAGIPATLVWTETTTLVTTSHPTLDNGWYSADLPFGTYTVTIGNPQYADEVRGPITISEASPYSSLDVALTRTWGNISGTISGNDLPDGIPATLVWTETTTSETRTGPTLDDGWFSADLPFGTYTVTISNPQYADEVRGPITINAASPYYNPLDVTLTRTWGNISGTVTAFETGTGYPATVSWTETTTGATHTGPTLADGWFSADLPFGTYMVTFDSFGYVDAVRGPVTINAASPFLHSFDVTIVRAWGNISGTVTRADTSVGIPATLVWTETTTAATTSHPTLDDGWFSSDRAFGTYMVTISSPGYADAVRGPITITAGSPYYYSLDVDLVGLALPAVPAVAVPTSGLEPDTKDVFGGCAALTPGAGCELQLPDGLSGQYVSVFGHSTPVAFGGWLLVGTDGAVAFTVPACFPAGAHKLVVQDAKGDVIGWKDVTVAATTGSGCTPASTTTGGGTGAKSTAGPTVDAVPTPTPTPTAEPEPEATEDAEEPADASGPVDEAGPDAQAVSVDSFPVGWVLGGVVATILLGLIVALLVRRARAS